MTIEKVKYIIWAADMDRALQFYCDFLGAKLVHRNDAIAEVSLCNTNIGIHSGGEGKRTWTGMSFQCDDLRAAIPQLKKAGGSLTREPNDTPEDPLHLAMCMDPEGNEIMLTQKR